MEEKVKSTTCAQWPRFSLSTQHRMMEGGGYTSISISKDLHHELLGSRW